jgi:hypothetical protein
MKNKIKSYFKHQIVNISILKFDFSHKPTNNDNSLLKHCRTLNHKCKFCSIHFHIHSFSLSLSLNVIARINLKREINFDV